MVCIYDWLIFKCPILSDEGKVLIILFVILDSNQTLHRRHDSFDCGIWPHQSKGWYYSVKIDWNTMPMNCRGLHITWKSRTSSIDHAIYDSWRNSKRVTHREMKVSSTSPALNSYNKNLSSHERNSFPGCIFMHFPNIFVLGDVLNIHQHFQYHRSYPLWKE